MQLPAVFIKQYLLQYFKAKVTDKASQLTRYLQSLFVATLNCFTAQPPSTQNTISCYYCLLDLTPTAFTHLLCPHCKWEPEHSLTTLKTHQQNTQQSLTAHICISLYYMRIIFLNVKAPEKCSSATCLYHHKTRRKDSHFYSFGTLKKQTLNPLKPHHLCRL